MLEIPVAKPLLIRLRSTFLNVSWGQTSPGFGCLPRLLRVRTSQWPFSCEREIHEHTIYGVLSDYKPLPVVYPSENLGELKQ